jgi:hypothetical protein
VSLPALIALASFSFISQGSIPSLGRVTATKRVSTEFENEKLSLIEQSKNIIIR